LALQAGLFSAALTSFVIDSKQNLRVQPQDQMVYYLQQHSTILSQISQQLGSTAPHISIPSTPPPPFPKFSPSSSDIRINVFWFMALIFSLSAALLAILVQQWVREYMHVFRYGDPLKSARLRQYLHEGSERWSMPRVAEAVPGLIHISLFLFFTGLVDSLLKLNTTVGLSAVIPIGIGVLLYIFTIFAPIIYPQSPYQNSFSGVIWYLFHKLHGRQYGSNGEWKPVSTNMAEGQVQLATEETEERKRRDVQGIRWLVDNLTEDTEMEQLLMAIPGSFNTEWGVEVWKKVSNTIEDESNDRLRPTSHHHPTPVTALQPHNVIPHTSIAPIGKGVMHDLSARVARSLEACKNRGLFAKDDWRKHTRACIETTASLAFGANADFTWFGDIAKLLEDIGVSEKPRELSLAGTDQLFVMRWTCLSLVAVQQNLEDNQEVREYADLAVESFAGQVDGSDARALTRARGIDETLCKARDRLYTIYEALGDTENLTEVKEILRNHVSEISELENINISIEAGHLGDVDQRISTTQTSIAHRITSQIPGVPNDLDPVLVPFSHFVEHFGDPRKLQFIRPGQTLKILCSIAPTLRNILNGQGEADAYKEMRKDLGALYVDQVRWKNNELQRQLWRLQDLRDGCGFAFTVELFFLALKQLLSTSSSKNSHFALYTGTFRAITSYWSTHKDSQGTRKLLLDIALSHSYDFQDGIFPGYIVDEFLKLLGNVFKGQGVHIDEALRQLNSIKSPTADSFWDRLSNAITSERSL
jgi:hypothetical protein